MAGVVILLLPRERVTRANFEKIQLGLSQDDLLGLLGPAVETRLSGKTLLEEGDHDCTLRRWNSAKMTIIVIADAAGRVVDRFEFACRRKQLLGEGVVLDNGPLLS
jgi:hypothetical protein